MGNLRIAILLRTAEGCLWTLPQIDELRRRGHKVIVILPAGPGALRERLRERGVETIDSPFDFRFRPTPGAVRGLWRLRRLLRVLRPDVLNYHLYAAALAARAAAFRLPLRRVHMVAGPLYLESPVVRPVERLLWRLDDLIICCTQHISTHYRALGCPAERRPVAQYGVDLGHFDPARVGPTGTADPTRATARASVRAELGLDDDVFVALMVANTYTPKRIAFRGQNIKGHDVLLAAWRDFHAAHPRSRLLMAGVGFTEAGEAHRRRLMDRFADDRSVVWLGRLPDLRPYFLAADVNVTPSLSEGSNGVVREASAMGRPSIVSDAGGLPEAVDGSFAWIVPRGDAAALGEALATAHRAFVAGELAGMGRRAREHALRAFDRTAAAEAVADMVTGRYAADRAADVPVP
ncbi:glycosyltransferase family 4 protein [Micromonospora sp. WMMD712]|uniref:glycosyltransferase family 4 protein n=1 Tax=Micromonospora sp. WMMD712 TaxID=3016096 RepID=UPI00249C07FD|nr:glycosyltransferase family 4 protein [Micromonospora sp. WMMD712]WFE61046.1 glycosyltransferase family 4 protein [Micromonospora sp. WMMD712]